MTMLNISWQDAATIPGAYRSLAILRQMHPMRGFAPAEELRWQVEWSEAPTLISLDAPIEQQVQQRIKAIRWVTVGCSLGGDHDLFRSPSDEGPDILIPACVAEHLRNEISR